MIQECEYKEQVDSYIPYRIKGNFTLTGHIPAKPGKYKMVVNAKYYSVEQASDYDYNIIVTFNVGDGKYVPLMGVILICIFIFLGIIGIVAYINIQ